MNTKSIVLLVLLFTAFSSYAQQNIPRGSLIIGGNISFSSASYKDNSHNEKASGFTIAPSAGIAVKDNLFVGVGLSYGHAKNSSFYISPTGDSTRYNSYGVNLFVRKYKPLKHNFYLFLETAAGVAAGKRDLENDLGRNFYQKDLSLNLGITPGISYALNSKLQLEAGFNSIFGVGYSKSRYQDNYTFTGERVSKSFNAFTTLNNFNSQIYLGFRLLVQKKGSQTGSSKG